ncbi:MAG: pchF 2 [Sphingomonas bacterium]|nr:pchF 2 [Sphingomonas bacterium]
MPVERFLAAAAGVVGNDHVIGDPAGLAPFARLMLPVPEEEHAPVGVVSPRTVEEVQALLRLAGEHKVPLWPTSTGRNFGYGTSAAATKGQVVLDLRRMNRILDVDPVLCTALVEPGVTYKQLQDHLRAEKLPLWIDFPAPGPLVSPIGNTLERGGGLTPYGDHFANSCGYEVVLADGTVLRTGMGGVKNTTSWQAFRYGYGPFLDGIFTQSNFGVVTKMGLWLMPAPETHRTGMAVWPEWGDMAKLIDAMRPLRLDGTIGNFGVLFDSTLALTASMKRADLYAGPGAVPLDLSIKTAKSKGLGAWHYLYTVYGRADRVAADWKAIEKAVVASGGTVIPDVPDPMSVGELTLQAFSLLNWVGGHGLAWFSPVTPMRGADAARQMEIARAVMDRHGVDFMTGMTLNGREGLNVMPMVFDRSDAESTARHRACFDALIDAFAAAGYGFYRTGIGFMDKVAAVHGTAQIDVNRRIKRALDPAGIIAPGKSGIRI